MYSDLTLLTYSNKCRFHEIYFSLENDEYFENFRICRNAADRTLLKMNGYDFCALVHYLKYLDSKFISLFTKNLIGRNKNVTLSGLRKCATFTILIRLMNPPRWPLDLKWNYIMLTLFYRTLELEKLMWWLSTLGGAFSALGDHAETYALQAGKISLDQLKLAFYFGDPVLICRCKLYIALSLMQTNRLKFAKQIIRQQYKKAVEFRSKFLKNCCKGVWSKLQYTYSVRKSRDIARKMCTREISFNAAHVNNGCT